MTLAAASGTHCHADLTGTNQLFKERAQSSGESNKGGGASSGGQGGGKK